MSNEIKTPEEVRKEINWRETEISKLQLDLANYDYIGDKEFLRGRITNLRFAISWCKWFLNEKQ